VDFIVLSKLRYFSQAATTACSSSSHELQSAIARHVERDFGRVTMHPVVGSTLGICFRADTVNKPFFIKTHRPDENSRENLSKEFDILKVLYGHLLRLDRFDLDIASGRRTCIVMDWLDINTEPIAPSNLRATIGECCEALENTPWDRAARFSTMTQLIDDGEHALVELERLQLVSADASSRIQPYFASLKHAISDLRPVICHGDLGNKNIMSSRGKNIIIDWEDAFVGFAGYDYLYWLTFMENRKYLSRSILGYTALDEKSERSVLLTVVTIKSLISVRSKTIQPSWLPIEQRLLELLTF
jgi:hypothetical protein